MSRPFAIYIGVLLLALLGFFMTLKWAWQKSAVDKQTIASLRAQVDESERRRKADSTITAELLVEQLASAEVTKEIIRVIPKYIPAGSCQLPPGWRVLHDAAARGAPPDSTGGPDGPGRAPEDPSETEVP